jgi:outer membrane murein-binding lipoprotein Lpp
MTMKGVRVGAVLLGTSLLAAGESRAQSGSPADQVADAVRDRGLACTDVVSAERDAAASRPDEAVWILTCSDARYRVRFPGDTAPQVERLGP